MSHLVLCLEYRLGQCNPYPRHLHSHQRDHAACGTVAGRLGPATFQHIPASI